MAPDQAVDGMSAILPRNEAPTHPPVRAGARPVRSRVPNQGRSWVLGPPDLSPLRRGSGTGDDPGCWGPRIRPWFVGAGRVRGAGPVERGGSAAGGLDAHRALLVV